MTRLLVLVTLVVAGAAAGCTLLLPTDELIVNCVESVDCDEGFECQDNACLPLDEELESSGTE
jgi:hypothetical protein